MVDRISKRELIPGDVLLSVGVGKTSEAICAFDGGQYSHAALWTGGHVIESTTPHVLKHTLEASLAAHPRRYVDAYRHTTLGAKSGAVIAAAEQYVNRRYSYVDLALAALLMATTAWCPTTASQETALLRICNMNAFLDLRRRQEGKLVICTELVARSYFEGGAPIHVIPEGGDRFDREAMSALFKGVGEIWHDAGPKRPISDAVIHWDETQGRLREHYLLLADLESNADLAPAMRALAAMIAGSEWGANLVTPRYLEKSPDLKLVGRLHAAPEAEINPAAPLS
jgi:hypothetical protein